VRRFEDEGVDDLLDGESLVIDRVLTRFLAEELSAARSGFIALGGIRTTLYSSGCDAGRPLFVGCAFPASALIQFASVARSSMDKSSRPWHISSNWKRRDFVCDCPHSVDAIMLRTKSKDLSSSEFIFEIIKLLGIMLVMVGEPFIGCVHRGSPGVCIDATQLSGVLPSSSLVSSGRIFISLSCKSLEAIGLTTDVLDVVLLLERLFGSLASSALNSFEKVRVVHLLW
jgi:hypothetical protein